MAQRTEKEETEFKVPETLTLCANNCGVTGNPATNNMCQNCFNATTASTAAAAVVATAAPSSSSSSSVGQKVPRSGSPRPSQGRSDQRAEAKTRDRPEPDAVPERKVVNRCSSCRRRVGLTGFRCRCGELFCAEHRYSDRHVCSYDYKAAGRKTIARENPVVKAAKIVRV